MTVSGFGEFLGDRDYDYSEDAYYEDDVAAQYEAEYLAYQDSQYQAYMEGLANEAYAREVEEYYADTHDNEDDLDRWGWAWSS